MTTKKYETLSEAIEDLKQRKYQLDFNCQADNDCLICQQHSLELSPDDFEIDEIHRFDNNSDPADETILFAISSKRYQVKGILVNAYGTYADNKSSRLMTKLFRK